MLAATAGAHVLAEQPFFRQFSARAYDAHLILRGTQPTHGIMLVVADQKALNAFPELLAFWHPYYAEAIRGAEAGGARAIALDVAFGIPVDKWAPDADGIIGEAVATAKIPLVAGFIPALVERQRERPIPVNMLAAALGKAGYANLTADPDDFIRRQELIEAPKAGAGEPATRSLAMRLAELAAGEDAKFEGDGRFSLAGKPIPLSDSRAIAINYAGPPGTFPSISLADFVEASKAGNISQLKSWVNGKIVLVGPDAIDDRYPTPFFTMSAGNTRWTTAGVEIHANTLQTVLSGEYLLPAPRWMEVVALFLISMLVFWSATALPTKLMAPAAVGILGLGLAGSHALFLLRLLTTDAALVSGWLLSLIGAIGYRFVSAENRRDLFRKAVTVFVGKELTQHLESSNKIGLSGKRLEVTILFTDIRGFTAFCENKDPSLIVDLLNTYMSQMVSIIVKHGGHVNKFIGDGILAIFSDDDGRTDGDHAARATRCAIEMVSAPNDFKTGAGIHTGMAVVGNIGSEDKMEYTVLGDTVNLASRLESLNKENKTRMLLSGTTKAMTGDEFSLTKLGAVPVRGKTEPVEIFTVTSVYDKPEVSH